MDYDKSMDELTARVLKVIDDLHEISNEYASWDEWNKTRIIDVALNALKAGYKKKY